MHPPLERTGDMSTAVDFSYLWDKHIKCPIRIGYVFDEMIFHYYFYVILCPLNVDVGREGVVDEANESIFFFCNHFIFGAGDDI